VGILPNFKLGGDVNASGLTNTGVCARDGAKVVM